MSANSLLRLAVSLGLRWRVPDRLIRPLNEVLHIWQIGVTTIMLPPGKLAVQQAFFYRGHPGRLITARYIKSLRSKQGENSAGVYGSHKASLLVQPFGISRFRYAVADECETR